MLAKEKSHGKRVTKKAREVWHKGREEKKTSAPFFRWGHGGTRRANGGKSKRGQRVLYGSAEGGEMHWKWGDDKTPVFYKIQRGGKKKREANASGGGGGGRAL